MKMADLATALFLGLAYLGSGEVLAFCPDPNPNLLGPGHFVDGCPLPAAGLNLGVSAAAPNFTAPLVVPGGGFLVGNRTATQVNRISDRLFVGQALANNNGSTSPSDWAFLSGAGNQTGPSYGQLVVLSTTGAEAIFGAARTLDLGDGHFGGASVGVQGSMIHNNPNYATGGWGGYFEGRHAGGKLGGADVYGVEIDAMNNDINVVWTPYNWSTVQDAAVGALLAAGNGLSPTYPSTAALFVNSNTQRWNKGIVFGSASLTTSIGSGGDGVAVEMATGQSVRWLKNDGTTLGEIWTDLTGFHIKAPSGTVTNFP